MESTVSSNGSLQLRPFSKWELLLKERICSQRERILSFKSSFLRYGKSLITLGELSWVLLFLLRKCVYCVTGATTMSYLIFRLSSSIVRIFLCCHRLHADTGQLASSKASWSTTLTKGYTCIQISKTDKSINIQQWLIKKYTSNHTLHEIYPANKYENANNCWHFNIYSQDKYNVWARNIVIFQRFSLYAQLKFHAQLGWAWEQFYNPCASISGHLSDLHQWHKWASLT